MEPAEPQEGDPEEAAAATARPLGADALALPAFAAGLVMAPWLSPQAFSAAA